MKKSETLVIEGCLASYNEQQKADRANKYAGAKLKKQNNSIVCLYAKSQLTGKYKRIKVDITWYCKNKMIDKDNIAFAKKYIFDGLQIAGVIKNDGWGEIDGWSDSFEVDNKRPRIEIVITEVKE